MAAVAGPTQEATTVLTPVPTDLPQSIKNGDVSQGPQEPIVLVSNEAHDNPDD